MVNVFSPQIFFVIFRETLEAAVILSVLLAFVKQGLGGSEGDKKLYRKLVIQIWVGAALGLFICLAIGGAFIGVFYSLGKDLWTQSEDLWEGIFSLVAAIMITVMGLAMLRINKMKEKWRVKIAQALVDSTNDGKKSKFSLSRWSKKYALALLPFVTTLREGIEAVVFVGGVSLGTPATAFPLAVICGLLAGTAVGLCLYFGGNQMAMQYFLIASTCFLYLIGSGLFSKAVWFLQFYSFASKAGGDVAESGSGPGSYNPHWTVWHVNCCNPLTDNGWMIFNALFGWQNFGTYGSVISYCAYWIALMLVIAALMYEEKKGYLPIIGKFRRKKKLSQAEEAELMRKAQVAARQQYGRAGSEQDEMDELEKPKHPSTSQTTESIV